MEDIVFYAIIIIILVLFCTAFTVSMFRGDYYREDERILKEHPYSQRARQIEELRRSGKYNIYIPKSERTNYHNQYGSINNDAKEKGGE